MTIALVGAELEENLGLRYMASILEREGHEVEIVPFNSGKDTSSVVECIRVLKPTIVGFSMIFTSRAREFCHLAQVLRENDYMGHIIAGGHFASFNCEQLLKDFHAFDSVALGEGEYTICQLASNMKDPSAVSGLCYRNTIGKIITNPSEGNPENLDTLPFPKRTKFHRYFDIPIASILSSRGCWRNCAFCSINAWYKRGGGTKFRYRSINNILDEMKQLYFDYGVKIFNFQDDNFFLPRPPEALKRFEDLHSGLHQAGITDIAIAIKARPDSINLEAIRILDDLGLFRVFLGVENASENALRNLNRKCTFEEILNALRILNDFDIHIAYNLLMFEPRTTLNDILVNLRFIERHLDNPFNFCRAEVYAGTGLEERLVAQNKLLGDYFGLDYRLNDPHAETFHKIANYTFFDRNFSNYGLHYFNMQVDFYYQLLRRFYPDLLTEKLRSTVRNFIKETNMDTYQYLCQIYDFVSTMELSDNMRIDSFGKKLRYEIDRRSNTLKQKGEHIIYWIESVYNNRDNIMSLTGIDKLKAIMSYHNENPSEFFDRTTHPYAISNTSSENSIAGVMDLIGVPQEPIPYHIFVKNLSQK